MKQRSIILGIILLLIAGGAFAANSRISWTPAELKPFSLAPGESVTETVTIKNVGFRPIPNRQLALVAQGDIAEYVSTTIASSSSVTKRGQEIVAEVTITAPEDMPLSILKGKLVLKRLLPNGQEKSILRASKLSVELTFSEVLLPPDPGAAGEDTLLGIDVDGNDVRDDIDRYIVFTHPDSAKVREALKQKARELSVFLRDADSKELSRTNALVDTSLDCLDYVYGGINMSDEDFKAFDQAESELRVNFLNTRARSRAYNKADNWLGGMVFEGTPSSELKDKCTFDPGSLPN